MPERKSTERPRTRKAERYTNPASLRAAVLERCREDWRGRTGSEWNDELTRDLRAALDQDLQPITDAMAGLVAAFDAARAIVRDYPTDDPRVAALREFLSTLSDKTVSWIGHFHEATSPEVARQLGFIVDATLPPGRTRLAAFEIGYGHDSDAGRLASLSLLLGYFPSEVDYPATVATVVDRERKAMVQAVKRARQWLKERRFERVRHRVDLRDDEQPPV